MSPKLSLNPNVITGIAAVALIAGVLYLVFPPTHASFRQNGVTIVASADRYRMPKNHQPIIFVQMNAVIPSDQHQWEIRPDDLAMAFPTNQGQIHAKFWAARFDPFGLYQTVTVQAKLCQFETFDQVVTFHHLTLCNPPRGSVRSVHAAGPLPTKVMTPDGITISWPTPDFRETPMLGHGSSYTEFTDELIGEPDGSKPAFLPNSPLCLQYHKPITWTWIPPAPFELNVVTTPGYERRWFSIAAPPSAIHPYANFPITIRERVELKAIPVTLILPIHNQPGPLP